MDDECRCTSWDFHPLGWVSCVQGSREGQGPGWLSSLPVTGSLVGGYCDVLNERQSPTWSDLFPSAPGPWCHSIQESSSAQLSAQLCFTLGGQISLAWWCQTFPVSLASFPRLSLASVPRATWTCPVCPESIGGGPYAQGILGGEGAGRPCATGGWWPKQAEAGSLVSPREGQTRGETGSR